VEMADLEVNGHFYSGEKISDSVEMNAMLVLGHLGL